MHKFQGHSVMPDAYSNATVTELLNEKVIENVLREEAKEHIAFSSWTTTCEIEEVVELEKILVEEMVSVSRDAYTQCSTVMDGGSYELKKQILTARTTLDGIKRYLYEERDIGGIRTRGIDRLTREEHFAMLNWLDRLNRTMQKNELELIKAIRAQDTPTWKRKIFINNMVKVAVEEIKKGDPTERVLSVQNLSTGDDILQIIQQRLMNKGIDKFWEKNDVQRDIVVIINKFGKLISDKVRCAREFQLLDENRDMYYTLVYGKLFIHQYKQLMIQNVPKTARKKQLPVLISENQFYGRKRIAIGLYCKHVVNRDPYKEAHDGTRYMDGSPVKSPHATPLPFPREKENEIYVILVKVHHYRSQTVLKYLPRGMGFHECEDTMKLMYDDIKHLEIEHVKCQVNLEDEGKCLGIEKMIRKILKYKWEQCILRNEFLKRKRLIEGNREKEELFSSFLSDVTMNLFVTGIGLLDGKIWDMEHSLLRCLEEIIAPTKREVFPTNLRQTVIDETEVEIKMRRETCNTMDKWGFGCLRGEFDSNDEHYSTDGDEDEKGEDEMSSAWRKKMYDALVALQKESRDVLPIHHQEYIFLKNAQSYQREINEMRERNEPTILVDHKAACSYHQLYDHLKETM